MKKYKLFAYLLFIMATACKSQNKDNDNNESYRETVSFEEKQKKDRLNSTEYKSSEPPPALPFNFRMPAKKAIPGVVHIISTYSISRENFPDISTEFWYRFFSESTSHKYFAKASGVIVSSDGYIVTNSHITEGAEHIEIVLENQRSYRATIVGADLKTDLALIKIDAVNLPFIEFGNSDQLEVGDWVLAVGNPFNLTSTVTAGIVSAKARNINALSNTDEVGSFIQTDAAINPGNSGGALVDMNGKLVGINSIIATPTGAYAGYSFATPVNIVKKIINDLLRNGKVNRGYLGLVLKNLTLEKSKQFNAETSTGIYIDSVIKGGAAMDADLKAKDIILTINEHKIVTPTQMWELIEQHSPGEILAFTILRNGKEKNIPVRLKELEEIKAPHVISKTEVLGKLGIEIARISEKEKKKRKIKSGLKVTDITKGKIYEHTDIKKGFIITRVNDIPVNTREDLENAFLVNRDKILIEGIYPGLPGLFYYYFGME